jgi:MFS family permease
MYAVTQFPGGILGDRIGERNVLVVGAMLAVVATVAAGFVWSVYALFGVFMLLGTATGIYATTRFTSLVDIYPDRAATATGLCSAAGNVGSVLLPAGMGFLAVTVGWRFGIVSTAPLFGLAAGGLWLTVPLHTSSQNSEMDNPSLKTVSRLISGISNRRTVILTVGMFLMSFVYQGFTSFYPTYLISVKGVSESTAALIYTVFFAAGILVQPLAGVAADAIGDRSMIVLFTGISALAFALLLPTEGFWWLISISILLSSQLGFWPVAQAAIVDTLPTEIQGTGFGMLRTIYLLLAAAAPAVIGVLADQGLFAESFLLLAGCSAITSFFGLIFMNSPAKF